MKQSNKQKELKYKSASPIQHCTPIALLDT